MLLRTINKFLLPSVCTFLAVALSPSSSRADILALDWAHLSAAYQSGAANSGTTQSFTVGSNTVGTVFGVVGNTTASNIFILSTPLVGTYGTTAPNTSYANGGVSDGTLALQIGIAVPDTTTEGVQFTINFSQAVYGATFQLFDVDYSSGKFTDQLRNILGVSGATTVLPTLTGSASNSVGTDANNATDGFSNSVTGTAGNAQNAGNGNVTVTFANNVPVTSISFIYGDNYNSNLGAVAPAATTTQLIALSNVQWSTVSGVSVPEPGTLATVGLGLATMSAVVLRRRRQG